MDTQTASDASSSQAFKILRQKMKEGSFRGVLRDWKWILSFSRDRWPGILLYTLLGMLASALGLASGVAGKYLIDCIVAMDKQRLPMLAVVMVCATVLSLALRSVCSRFSARLGVTLRNDVQGHVFRNLLSSRWLELRQFPTGDLLNRFTTDVGTVASCAVSWVPGVVIHLFTGGALLRPGDGPNRLRQYPGADLCLPAAAAEAAVL